MSVFDLDIAGQRVQAERAALNPLDAGAVEPPTFYRTTQAVGSYGMAGFARVGNAGMLALGVAPIAYDALAGGTAAQDAWFDVMDDTTADAVKYWTPGAQETGSAGRLLGGLAQIGTELMSGGVSALAVTEGLNTGVELVDQGVGAKTAAGASVIQAATMGAGALIPGSGIVTGKLADLALTAGGNAALGVANRGALSGLLSANGYEAQAQQYQAFDKASLATDLVMGGMFWGLSRGLSHGQIDSALTHSNARNAQVETAPGVPVDAASSVNHQQALGEAINQLQRGEPVEVPPAAADGTFLQHDRGEAPVRQELQRVEAEQARRESMEQADNFAARVGRDAEYDADGAPIFRDGTAYPLSEATRFFDDHVARTQPKDGAPVPDVLFQVGRVDDNVAAGLHDFLPGFHEGLREARISAATIKHIQDSRPSLVRDVLEQLQRGSLNADEVLPNPKNRDRALIVLHDAAKTTSAKGKHLSHVVEVSANGKGIDVVTVMSARDGALKEARALRDEVTAQKKEKTTTDGGATYPSSSLEAGLPRQPHAAADFPTFARDQEASITSRETAASDPEVQLAEGIVAQMDDLQLPTGALDAEGNPVTVSAREMLADADAAVQQAENDTRGFMAAAACFLQRGN